MSCDHSLAEQLLNATGVITKIDDDFGPSLYYFKLDELWKSLYQSKEGLDYCASFDYRFEIIEKFDEFDNFKLMSISRELTLLSMEFQQIFTNRIMPQ